LPATSEASLLRIHIGEADRHGRKPLYQAIVEMLRDEGIAGATTFKGIDGFGARSVIAKRHSLSLSHDRPLIIEVVDRSEAIDAILPRLDAMVTEGLMTRERIQVVGRELRDMA
jgi:PII-like signaling protein